MKGEFEYALMYFHRGHKMRPELSEFSRGISKSTEAIENSVSYAFPLRLIVRGHPWLTFVLRVCSGWFSGRHCLGEER